MHIKEGIHGDFFYFCVTIICDKRVILRRFLIRGGGVSFQKPIYLGPTGPWNKLVLKKEGICHTLYSKIELIRNF